MLYFCFPLHSSYHLQLCNIEMIRLNRNAKLTGPQKGRILSLHLDQNLPVFDIANIVGATEKTVRKWINRNAVFGNVDRLKPPGRPRKTTPEQDHEIVQYLRDNPFSTATRAAALQNVPYGIAKRRIRESEIKCHTAAMNVELTENHRNARVRFARYMLDEFGVENFQKIIFSDEKTFRSDENHKQIVYRPKSARYDERFVVEDRQSGKVTAGYWGWISCAGTGEIVATGNNFNSIEYINVLDQVGFRSIEAQFGGLDNIVFQQDNAKWHTARIVRDYLETRNVEVLDWPARSPDLNPIELVWANMEKTRCPLIQRNQPALNQYVLSKWENLRLKQDFFQHLYEGFEKRLEFVIQNNGGICHTI